MASVVAKSVAVDTVTWTAITVPIACNQVYLVCRSSDVKVRTDSTDATTEDMLIQGVQEVYGSPGSSRGPWTPRFVEGEIVCYVQAVAGTGPVIVKAVR